MRGGAMLLDMESRKLVGINVRKYREKLDLSQEELAFEANMHRTYISGVERGVRNPTLVILDRLAKALKVKPHELISED
jgi:transcriptional regulator with XRE-family HTH domain